jgi:hypothetical protein
MLLIGRFCFRTAILAYAALLIVGAWPYHAAPLIGPPAGWASRSLGKVSIRPGMPVFNAGEPARVEWKLHALCQQIVGLRATGAEEGDDEGDEVPLYTPECPPTGFQIGVDSFRVMLLRIAKASSNRELLTAAPRGPVRRSRSVRRYIALGDWFCRAPEGGGSRFDSVRLTQQRHFQSYDSGAYRRGPVLVCRWQCSEEPAPLPRCQQLPAAAIGGKGPS